MRADPLPLRTGCIIGDRIIVLDRRRSRYFMVRHEATASPSIPRPHQHQAAILSWPDDRTPRHDNARATWVQVPRAAVNSDDYDCGRWALACLWGRERNIRRYLKKGIDSGLDLLGDVTPGDPDIAAQHAAIGASWRSRRLWSAEDRCLPRALSLAIRLRQLGSDANLVLGVTAQPFTAHAWVQEKDVVLDDTLDHATLFTPILVA